MDRLTINIKGMSCNHCKMAVEQALQTLQGVESADVDLESNTAQVVFDSSQIDEGKLKAAITQAGYEVID
jgi:copper chaperone